ncbi:MAG: hypothetical protein ACI9WM_001116, partial [Arenicella sp.]
AAGCSIVLLAVFDFCEQLLSAIRATMNNLFIWV